MLQSDDDTTKKQTNVGRALSIIKEGRYYYIEMACDGHVGASYVSNTKPADQVILKLYEFIRDNSPLDGDCPPGREMNGPICERMKGNCELCMFDAAVESVMKE